MKPRLGHSLDCLHPLVQDEPKEGDFLGEIDFFHRNLNWKYHLNPIRCLLPIEVKIGVDWWGSFHYEEREQRGGLGLAHSLQLEVVLEAYFQLNIINSQFPSFFEEGEVLLFNFEGDFQILKINLVKGNWVHRPFHCPNPFFSSLRALFMLGMFTY